MNINQYFLKITIASLLFGLPSSLATAEDSTNFPITVVDDRNISVTIDKPPVKVASLSIFAADIMTSLGLTPIGTTTYNGVRPLYLGENISNTLDFGAVEQPNLELLMENNVDLIIGLRRYTEPYADDFNRFSKYLAYNLLTFEDSNRAIESVSTALNQKEKGIQLNVEFKKLLKEHADKAPGDVSAVFLWMWQDAIYAYYDHPMPAKFFSDLKVSNTMGVNPMPDIVENFGIPISYEELLAMDPDVIFAYRTEGNNYPDNPVLKRLKAIKNNRAYHVGYHFTQATGPIARKLVLKEMSHLLYPEIYEKPDLPVGVAAQKIKFQE